ncbi:hypothetical protein, partial [Sphingomonas astaxanthinifaciens]|uniref:hypothetical protein n=1 Tax=Sphingomonas astaxanthinifaciens TaxID=407019 RepID=UPI0024E12E45
AAAAAADDDGALLRADLAAAATVAFAEAARIERAGRELGPDLWLFGSRAAVFTAIPFAIFGAWSLLTVVLAVYATVSFFVVQNLVHAPNRD